ncbi:T9SS type A sorting domain-containing protein [Bacteroidota bacterium]
MRTIGLRDSQTIFIGGYNGPPGTHVIFIFSQNQGQTWTKTTDATFKGINGMQFIDNSIAYSYGYGSVFFQNSGIMKTTNGGSTWSYVADNSSLLIEGMHFINADTGFFAVVTMAGVGSVQKTSNGGNNFSVIYNGTGDWIHDVWFFNSDTGFALEGLNSASKNIIKTTDAGQNWTSTTFPYDLTEIVFIDKSTGYALGGSGAILKTSDGGSSWQNETSGISTTIRCASYNENYIYACGSGGKVIKSLHGVSQGNFVYLQEDYDIKIYPNPASSFLIINSNSPQLARIDLFSIHGKIIREKEINDMQTVLRINDISAGVYFLKITTLNNEVLIKKISINQ